MKIRYAITAIRKDGLRHLALPNWGENHFDTKEAAELHLNQIKAVNDPELIAETMGTNLRVDSIECYDNGDATRTIF